MRKFILAVVLLGLSTQVQAGPPPGDPLTDALYDEAVQVLNQKAEKIYLEEGGKRDRKTITAEIITNTMLSGVVQICGQSLNEKNYPKVHKLVQAAESVVGKSRAEYSEAHVDINQLSLMNILDGAAFLYEKDVTAGIRSLEKALGYTSSTSDQAFLHSALAKLYFNDGSYTGLNKQERTGHFKKGMQHMDKAIALNPDQKKELNHLVTRLKEEGLLQEGGAE